MTELVMNEIAQAENIINSGDFGSKPGISIFLVARYMAQVLNMEPNDISERISNIMAQTVPGFIKANWKDKIDTAAAQGNKRKLTYIKSIGVTKSEMEKIDTLPTKRLRRLAFTMVVIAKYYNIKNNVSTDWINCQPSDVFRMACINATKPEQAAMYRELTDAGIIGFSNKTGSVNAHVLIIDGGDDYIFEVIDMRNVGHSYMMYQGKSYAVCQRCGITFKNSKMNNRKFCKECSNWHPIERRRFNCCDCGKDVFVVSRNTKSIRCPTCQTKENNKKKELYRLRRNALSALS